MQTSTIRYRVADFLKQFPPFQFFEPDHLLELAGAGRVRFHEGDELIFQQGSSRKPSVWVIRQGAVRLYEGGEDDPSLRDMLGEGELLGIGRFMGAEKYLYSAKTSGDVLLYAFPAEVFQKFVDQYPAVQRYLEAYFSVQPDAVDAGEKLRRSGDPRALTGLAAHRLLTCRPEATLKEAAAAMRERDAEAIVIADASRRPLGILTWRQLRDRLAEGALAIDDPAEKATSASLKTVQGGLPIETYQLEMMGSAGYIVITADGSASSPATGLLSAVDISLLMGVNPTLLALEAGRAERPADLAPLVSRAKALVAQALDDHRRAEWAAHVAGELNATIVQRLITLAERDLADLDASPPTFRRCWMLLGGAGRRELMTWVDLDIAVVFEDLPDGEREAAAAWLGKVGERVDSGLQACGFRFTETAVRATSPRLRLPFSGWRDHFDGWIMQPLFNRIYSARSFFDFLPMSGDRRLAHELRSHMLARVAENPGFLLLLANDCLANLPPLTFFQGLVVEDGGVQSEKLDLRRAALFPLMDTARVLGLRYGEGAPGTFERFATAARHEPDQEKLFAGAQEAYRVVLAHRGRQGLGAGDDGSLIDPSELSKVDQQILKGAFRTIVDLLGYTRAAFQIEGDD